MSIERVDPFDNNVVVEKKEQPPTETMILFEVVKILNKLPFHKERVNVVKALGEKFGIAVKKHLPIIGGIH